jgi:hypothetical protein
MPKLDSLTVLTRSGETYKFRVYILGNQFKPVRAVYLVSERSVEPGEKPRYKPVYVGETADLSSVSDVHERDECFQMYLANTIAVLPENDALERARIVLDLIKSLKPPCNLE